ncbi:MAG: biotin/lipoyl-containing protein [Acidobacteriota bacterium]
MKLTSGPHAAEIVLGAGSATVGDRTVSFRERERDGEIVGIEIAGETVPVRVLRQGDRVSVWCAGRTFEIERTDERRRRGPDHAGGLLAPMPGRVRRVMVEAGDVVTRGQILLVLEAMKMEHAIRSPQDGTVVRLGFAEGDLVEAGAPLVEIAAAAAP